MEGKLKDYYSKRFGGFDDNLNLRKKRFDRKVFLEISFLGISIPKMLEMFYYLVFVLVFLFFIWSRLDDRTLILIYVFSFFLLYYLLKFILFKFVYKDLKDVFIENGVLFFPKEITDKNLDISLELEDIDDIVLKYFLLSNGQDSYDMIVKTDRKIGLGVSMLIYTQSFGKIKLNKAVDFNTLIDYFSYNNFEVREESVGILYYLFGGFLFFLVFIFPFI